MVEPAVPPSAQRAGPATVFKQGDDHSGRLIRVGGRQDAFFDPMTDNPLQPGRKAFDSGEVEFVADDGILIGIPDAQVREFPAVERGKEALEFVKGAKSRIRDDGEHELFDLVPHAFDQRQEQRRFGVKVVIERPGRNPQLPQQIGNRHPLIACGCDGSLGRVENDVALDCVFVFFDDAYHGFLLLFHKQSLGLLLQGV